jgi:exodeoxyribonuclease VII large subunit
MQRQLHLARHTSSLAHLNPENVLARGYSIVQMESGGVVQDATPLKLGDSLRIRFHHGRARAIVQSIDQDTTPD